MKEKILKLRKEGKTYNEIVEILGCSKGTVSYHCGVNQKEKARQRRGRIKKGILVKKEKKLCLNCESTVKNNRNKYCCFSCSSEHRHKVAYKKILDGDPYVMRADYCVHYFKKDIIKEQGDVCNICKIPQEWNNKNLVFVLDHIDGDAANNNRGNLRCICPNCDSQLDTYKSKNKKSSRTYRYNTK
jgi:hypothetical protein